MVQMENEIPRPQFLHALFLLLVTFLVYAPSVRFPFLKFDDVPFIVENEYAHQWSSLPSFFTGSTDTALARNAPKLVNFYRPVVSTWALLNYKLFGLRPAFWHLSAIALYALGVWLLWRIAWKLSRNDFVALAAALLYALHPMHVEGVVWIAGSCVEMLLNVFFLAGFFLYLCWRDDPRTVWLAGCGVAVLCGLLSKETAAVLPLLILTHALLFRLPQQGGSSSRGLRLTPLVLTLTAAVGVYIALRIPATHGAIVSHPRHSWGDAFRTAPLLLVTYLKLALWPARLGTWYEAQIVPSFSDLHFYLPLAILLGYAAVMTWALARKKLVGFLLLWWVAVLGPPLAAVRIFPDFELLHDRFASVPLAGLCILAALALDLLPSADRVLFGFKAAGAFALAVITAVFGVLTVRQVDTWTNDMAMYAHAVEVSPRSVRPRILLGGELIERKDIDRALILYRDTLRLDPDRWESIFALSITLAHTGNSAEAIRLLEHGLQVSPTRVALYHALAGIQAGAGQYDEAFKVLERGIATAEDPGILKRELIELRARQQSEAAKP